MSSLYVFKYMKYFISAKNLWPSHPSVLQCKSQSPVTQLELHKCPAAQMAACLLCPSFAFLFGE